MGRAATSSVRDLLQCGVRRATSIQQNHGWICCHLSFALLRASIMSIRSSGNMPGNAALCDPIDFQSTFYKHSRYVYLLHSKSLRFHILLYFILQIFGNYACSYHHQKITLANETFMKFTIMSHPSHTVTIIKINVSLARVIKKFTIMKHPSHTGLFSYTSTYLQLHGCCT